MMKKIFTTMFMGAMLMASISVLAQESLFISEIADPEDDYTGRFIELYNAGSEALDFSTSTFYLTRQSNGGTTWGDLQLTGTVAAGAAFVIGGSGFEALYGFAPDQESGILIGNGDDVYALFQGGDHETGVLYDILGVIDVDGTGEPWEYTDSRALRLEAILTPNPTWTASEWAITPADVADCNPGEHNGSVVILPPGDYALALINDTVNGGQPVEVPVEVSQLTIDDNIISYQFDIDFDQTVLEYTGYSVAGTLAEGGTLVVNTAVAGKLSLGYMNTTAITGAGEILLLQFNSLALDTTDLVISNAFLNSVAVSNLIQGRVIITETAPPTAVITYSDTLSRFADTLIITASFSEAMDAANPVLLSMSGALSLTDAAMTRLGEMEYNYHFPIPKASGEVNLSLGNGTDLWGNIVVPEPTAGASFTILPFTPGDVDDDGMVLAYDAALTLQYSVGMDPLSLMDPLPWEPWRDSTANVDAMGGITAYDAGLILQFSAGLIADFSGETLKSASMADMTVEIVDQHIVFRSHGNLLGVNLSTVNKNDILGTPEVLIEDFMSAFNMDGNTYKVGLCTATSALDGDAVMKIPFKGSGRVTFKMVVNTAERMISVDLATGVIETEKGDIEIYPNPLIDILHVSGLTGPVVARIYSIHGQEIVTFKTDGETGELDLRELPSGIYMLKLETDSIPVVRRFIKR